MSESIESLTALSLLERGKVLVPGYNAGGKRRYHTDPNCHYVNDSFQEWDREMAEAWDLKECKECSGEYERSGV